MIAQIRPSKDKEQHNKAFIEIVNMLLEKDFNMADIYTVFMNGSKSIELFILSEKGMIITESYKNENKLQ
jgi:hypothetical protein